MTFTINNLKKKQEINILQIQKKILMIEESILKEKNIIKKLEIRLKLENEINNFIIISIDERKIELFNFLTQKLYNNMFSHSFFDIYLDKIKKDNKFFNILIKFYPQFEFKKPKL